MCRVPRLLYTAPGSSSSCFLRAAVAKEWKVVPLVISIVCFGRIFTVIGTFNSLAVNIILPIHTPIDSVSAHEASATCTECETGHPLVSHQKRLAQPESVILARSYSRTKDWFYKYSSLPPQRRSRENYLESGNKTSTDIGRRVKRPETTRVTTLRDLWWHIGVWHADSFVLAELKEYEHAVLVV